MGHFSHNCKLSHLPITGGTPVVLFLLKMRDNLYDHSEQHLRKYGSTYLCSNEGTTLKYIPVGFPIRGKYNDYGGIEDIVEDENTKVLETHFGLTIQEICDITCSGRKDDGYDNSLDKLKEDDSTYEDVKYKPEYKELISLSGMWVHRGFYDELVSTHTISEYGDKIGLGTPELLKYLGFEYVKEPEDFVSDTLDFFEKLGKGESKDDRYNQKYKKDNLEVYSDGTWLNCGIYTFRDFKKYCIDNGTDIDISELIKSTRVEQIYDFLLPSVRNELLEDKNLGVDEWDVKNIKKLLRRMSRGNDRKFMYVYNIFNKQGFGSTNVSDLTTIYVKEAIDGKFKKLIQEFNTFNSSMYSCGKFYDVVGTSVQDGDHKEVNRVLQIAQKILEPILEEYDNE